MEARKVAQREQASQVRFEIPMGRHLGLFRATALLHQHFIPQRLTTKRAAMRAMMCAITHAQAQAQAPALTPIRNKRTCSTRRTNRMCVVVDALVRRSISRVSTTRME